MRTSIDTQFKPVHGYSGEVGGKRNPTYTAWRSMHARCRDPSRKDFHRYGGRGISVCDRWKSFEAFLSDMGEKSPPMQLGRIDNDGMYEPNNCRWETPSQQARNRRNTVYVHAFGQTQSLCEWAERFGIRADTLKYRLRRGLNPEAALSIPVKFVGQKACR